MTQQRPHVSIASDNRARIPFAVIGVLLLLSSVAVVGVLQSRPEPQRDIDPSLVLDRSEAATQSAVKAAVLDAADRAAAAPVVEPATDGPFAELLGDETTSQKAVFRNYTALLVYRAIHSHVNGTTYSIRDDTTATISVPAINDRDDAADAMDRVSFEAGYETSSRQSGTVRVTIDDVTFQVRQTGDHVFTRDTDVTVVVATPLFQVHDRVSTYQDRLEMSMFEGGGFTGIGREFAARTYPIVMAKSFFNYAQGNPDGAPIQRIVPEKQTSVLLNHANYAVQSKTFKTRDPLWDRPTKSNLLCWLAWEADQNYDGSADNFSVMPTPDNASLPASGEGNPENYQYFCQGAEFLFGDATGTPGDFPSIWDIVTGSIDDESPMNKKETVNYTLFAEQAYVDLHPDIGVVDVDETDLSEDTQDDIDELDSDPGAKGYTGGTLDAVIESIYQMDLAVQTRGSGPSLSVTPNTPGSIDDPSNWTRRHTDTTYTDRAEDVSVTENWQTRSNPANTDPKLFTVHIEDTVTKSETYEWEHDNDGRERRRTFSDTGTVTLDVDIRGEFTPDAAVTLAGDPAFDAHSGAVENLFEGDNGVDGGSPRNFDRVPESAFCAAFALDRLGHPEGDLETLLDGTIHTSTSDAWETLGKPAEADGTTLGPDTVTSTARSDLEAFAKRTLQTGKQRVLDEGPREYARKKFLTSNPFEDMKSHLAGQHEAIVYDDDDPFTGMPTFLRAEILHRYHQAAVSYTGDASRNFETAHNELTDRLDGESSLDEAMDLAQDAVNRDPPNYGGVMESTDLLGGLSFEVRGSPTYLEFDYVNRSEVPAVRPAGNAAMNLTGAAEVNHVTASECTINRFGYFGFLILPTPSSWVVTTSSWGVYAKGEYARFEVTANLSEPSHVSSLTYVREDKNVSIPIGGQEAEIGSVEPIGIDTFAEFPMVVPSGKAGTGDPAATGEVMAINATDEWASVGPGYDPDDEPDDSC